MTTHSWGESPLGIDDDFDDNDIIGYNDIRNNDYAIDNNDKENHKMPMPMPRPMTMTMTMPMTMTMTMTIITLIIKNSCISVT